MAKRGKTGEALGKYDEALKYAPNWTQRKDAREVLGEMRTMERQPRLCRQARSKTGMNRRYMHVFTHVRVGPVRIADSQAEL
jgi:hypothetical protein